MNFSWFPRAPAAFVVLGFVPAVCAETIQLAPSRDTTVHSENSTASNGAGPVFFAGRTNRGDGMLRRALVHFDVTGIPAGSVITSVSLVLSVTREPGTPPQNGTLRRLLASWGEAGSSNTLGNGAEAENGDATWSHRFFGPGGQTWTTQGGDFAAASGTAPFGAAGSTVTFASTPALVADVQGWVNNAATNHGWAVLGDETGIGSATQFASRENSDPALQPRLVINYTPAVSVPALPVAGQVALAAALVGAAVLRLSRGNGKGASAG